MFVASDIVSHAQVKDTSKFLRVTTVGGKENGCTTRISPVVVLRVLVRIVRLAGWLAGWAPLWSARPPPPPHASASAGLLLAGWHGCSGEPARFIAETLLHLTAPQSSTAAVRSRQSIN